VGDDEAAKFSSFLTQISITQDSRLIATLTLVVLYILTQHF
jgi:hypothetical protein